MQKSIHIRQTMRAYIALLFLTMCVYALMYSPQPMFNTLSQQFGVNYASIALTVSVFMISLSVAPLCVGLLLGKIGARTAITTSVIIIAISGAAFPFIESLPQFLAVRIVQGLLTPVLLTAIMSGIAHLFRHLNLERALAGYITVNLVGSLLGRLGGGICAEHFGWRMTLAGFCFIFPVTLLALRSLPDEKHRTQQAHRLSEYLLVLKQEGVKPLLFVEACGIFIFSALGNLIPFRMAELGHGHSEGLTGLMYLGYAAGLVASMAIGPLLRFFGSTKRFLLTASALFMCSFATMAFPSVWMLFGGLWLVATGQFLVHSICPGLINRLSTQSGQCDCSMVNGLFLSVYYIGGVLGSLIPAFIYGNHGWLACYACMQTVLVMAFGMLVVQRKHL